jgi:hypothetical protein
MATTDGQYLYVGGGFTNNFVERTKTYRYDPGTNTWDDAAIADLPSGRAGAASALFNGRWTLAGGFDPSLNPVNSVVGWNPMFNAWADLPPLLDARFRLHGDVVGGGFSAVGGSTTFPFDPTNLNQRYTENGCITSSPTPPASATPTVTATPTACAVTFNDVPANSTFYSWIRCLACRGIVGGYPCGGPGEPCPGQYYRPNNNVTRGQVAKIVSEAAGFSDPVPSTQQSFEDVPPSGTFWLWVERLATRGLISGYPCGGPFEPCVAPDNRPYFRPNNNVTRGQLAKITSGAAGWTETPTGQTFEDVAPASTFYRYIERMAVRGIIAGYPCGSNAFEPCVGPANRPYFRPNNNATRGQMSKIAAEAFFPNCATPAGLAR